MQSKYVLALNFQFRLVFNAQHAKIIPIHSIFIEQKLNKIMASKNPSSERRSKSPFSRSNQHEVKLQTILSEAARLFNFQGTRATTLGDIARSIGLTKTSLYYYARNKEELVYQCYLASCDAGDEIMAEASQGAETGLECLCNFVKVFFARWEEIDQGQRPYTAMLIEIPTLADQHREEIEKRVEKHFGTMLKFLKRGIKDGSISDCAPIPTTQAFLAIVYWSYVWFRNVPVGKRPAAIQQLLSLIKGGISADTYQFSKLAFPELEDRLPAGFDRDKQNEIKRSAFLQVGSQMFNERGYMGASLDDVAEQLDVTKGAFYYHIQNKEDLLYQCFQRTLELIGDMIERAGKDGHNGAEKIELVLRYLFNVQLSDDGPLIAYRCLPSLSIERRNEILQQTQASSERLGSFISEGIKDGSIRDVKPGIIENAIAGTIDAAPGIAEKMRLKNNSKVSAEYLELFFNGIASRT
jgi:AcrR family transcriptional regulator